VKIELVVTENESCTKRITESLFLLAVDVSSSTLPVERWNETKVAQLKIVQL
jgi:hypothetical protein